MDDEYWIPVRGHEATHEVSSHGRIRTKDHTVIHPVSRKPVLKHGKIIESSPSRKYMVVNFPKTETKPRTSELHHRVVAAHFVPNPYGTSGVVHHIDGNKRNNHPTNLRWMVPAEHGLTHGRYGPTSDERWQAIVELAKSKTLPISTLSLVSGYSREAIYQRLKQEAERLLAVT